MTWKTRESMLLHSSSSPLVSLFLHDHSWSPGRKWGTTLLVSAFTFMGPVSSSMIAPASKQLAERFDIHNTVLLAMTTSVYVLAYGAYPMPIILTYLSQHLFIPCFCSYHSLWTIIPQSAQRGIWALACHTNGKLVVPRYTLCMSSADVN